MSKDNWEVPRQCDSSASVSCRTIENSESGQEKRTVVYAVGEARCITAKLLILFKEIEYVYVDQVGLLVGCRIKANCLLLGPGPTG